MAYGGNRRPQNQAGRVRSNVDTMFVLRTDDGRFLGRGGKHLSLCIVNDVREASPFCTVGSAIDDGHRAEQILGISFVPVREPVKNLIRKEKLQ